MRRFLLILLIGLLGCQTTWAQSRYHFNTLGMDQGLSSNFVWSIGQDKFGFIWIGTNNGLNRYDGHSIQQYHHNPKDSFSLPGDVVYWIFTDRDKDIWFACGQQGIVRYNYAKDRFEKLAPYEEARQRTKHTAPVWRICEDQQGRIYINCGGSLFRYTKSNKLFEDLTPLFNGAIDNEGVAMVIPQSKDVVWVLTDGGLFHYDLLGNKVRKVPFDKEKLGYGLAAMHDGEFINSEEMLISMGRPGFVIFNTRTWQFKPAPAPFNPAVSNIFTETGGVMKDTKGRYWLANSFYGLVEFFPSGNASYSLKKEPSYPYPYAEEEGKGMNVFEDKDGNVWYGTSQRGVVWFQPQQDFIKVFQRQYGVPASLGADGVFCFAPGGNNEVLVGTSKGLSRINQQTDAIFNFPYSVTGEGQFPASVRSFTQRNDSLVMATAFGLSVLNQRTGRFSRITVNEDKRNPFQLFSNGLAKVMYTNPGELVLLGFDEMLARYDIKTGKCFSKANDSTNDPLYRYSNVSCLANDSLRKMLWLEAGAGELHAYDYQTGKGVRHSFSNDSSVNTIAAISVDPVGKLWLATNIGLILYDPVSGKSHHYRLPTATQNIHNVSTIDGETIWITTSSELVKLQESNGKAIPFNLNKLVPHVGAYHRSLYVDKNNNAWIGSNKGFFIVDNKSFKPRSAMSIPHLVNFKVFDKNRLFDEPYFDVSRIELAQNENFFSFDFSVLDYHQSGGVQYAYRLVPFDKDWNIGDKNSASYTNVPPGDYKLLLRAQYGEGQWQEATPISVHIQAPYWQRWWFVTLLAIAFAFSIYLLFRFREKRKREKRMDETIDYFANSQYGENSVSEICWDIARNCIAQLRLEDCVVYLLDEKRNVLVQRAAYGPKNPKEHEIINPIDIQLGKGIVGTVAATAKPVIVRDTTKDKRYIVDDANRMSELAVPIIHEGKAIGVIDSEHPRKNFFGDEHVKVLSTIAAISANKIAEAKAEAAARESQIQLLEIKKLLAESQLMALRAQMNPHFVFNCLNSIQECIVTQKYGEASLYLNKFAKLFRSVLNNSGKAMVTLAEEIEVLDLYLSLEYMRFEKSFTYTIYTDEELEADEILIPSMLVQPYVENALWHGLMHKEGDRKLCIAFTKKSETVFECVIEDNGIGRKKALELKEQQSKTKRHVSKGMTISKDRIDLLQKQGQHAMLEIIDKQDEKEIATGTKVVIELSSFLQ